MQFPRHLMSELVPHGLPPDRFLVNIPDELTELIKDEPLRRSYLWSIAIMNAGLESRLVIPPRLSNYSTGFVHISEQNRDEKYKNIDGFSYGANILIESQEPILQRVLPLEVGGTVFPVVINFGKIEKHGLPTNPHTGTGTCWIENQDHSGHWEKGILTCSHTVESFSKQQQVQLHPSTNHVNPTIGVLDDITSCIIDAAVIGIANSEWPSGLVSLPICSPVAPGQQVSFEGRSSTGSGTVLRTFQYSKYWGNLFGQRIFTDCHGKPGDSGSLFFDPSINNGLGIYIGTVPDGSGGEEGICQDLYQASQFFDFSTFW